MYQLLMIFTRWYGSDRMVPGLKSYLGSNLSQTGNSFGTPYRRERGLQCGNISEPIFGVTVSPFEVVPKGYLERYILLLSRMMGVELGFLP